MGHWEDAEGNWFWDEDELIEDIGESTIWESVDTIFNDWLDENYTASSILNGDYDEYELLEKCYSYVISEMSSSIIEGEDWYDYGIRYIWVDNDDEEDEEEVSYNRKPKAKNSTAKARGTAKKRPQTKTRKVKRC